MLISSGCASVGTPINGSNVSSIQKGITTKDQILKLFGNPSTSTISDNGTMFIYSFAKTQTSASTFIPIVGIFHSGYNTDIQTLSIVFDDKNIVKNYSYTSGKNSTSAGIIP